MGVTKSPENRRTERIPVNCTATEKQKIEDNARKAGLSTSDYLRMKGLQQ
jgi:hypothetical protein